jgi:hypothetical protein
LINEVQEDDALHDRRKKNGSSRNSDEGFSFSPKLDIRFESYGMKDQPSRRKEGRKKKKGKKGNLPRKSKSMWKNEMKTVPHRT